ncbi:plasmid replication protein, CyRepA1 family [Anabaena cylindrica UHCC 0172]|uniref:plasmid replication protein, CyRepA1 family n=1 Tax=Anabaena cylindrica TaxID=1165 RepID=UPI002B20BAEB|nr:plasmid replication protein, CyRepA1 family [Anabaena cylindrica]MEA5551785.1 plasmid replication protein, CyRepA1 family [Anabaena cylindrica UHCC 0172]
MLTEQQLFISTPEIAQPHRDEWLESAIDPEIISLNLRSLWGTTPYEYLLYSPKISRRNDGRLRDGDLKKYRHIELGGWWCNGVDPLNNYQQMLWGCFKPNKPRRDLQKIHKIIKYEHPYKEATRAFFLYVTEKIWAKISDRCGIPITEEDRLDPRGFWYWVWRHNVPLIICEGVKKAAALLTAGYAAIAIPGVNNGYRTSKDEYGNTIGKPYLIPEIQHFATPGRQVNICFDHDSNLETRKRVRTAINRMGSLLIGAGCEMRVIDLPPGAEKGVDDFIAAKGQDAFHALYNTAEVLEMWQIRLSTLLTYPPAISLNQRFLGEILIPASEKLIVLKAPKGTGKTESLTLEVAKAHERGQRVLVITHRIQLGEALCNRFGVNYVTEIHDSEIGDLLGYGVCIDSLHTNSQAKFNPNDWSNDIVIIDEADQVFWHLLNSGTEVSKRRVSVLNNLKQLVQNVLSSPQGKIYLSSADISDADVNYILSLAGGIHIKPFVIVNDYQLESGNCYNYQGKDPRNLIAALDMAIAQGGHHLLCCSAQKMTSKWGTQALEKRYQSKFPHLRILRIDGETVKDPNHPAYGCIAHLNEILTEYDLVITSPSLETGVSIDIKSHFSAVWGVFQGVQPVNSVRQMLARLRETVDRHIWVREWGLGVIGNGSTSMGVLLASQHAMTRANIALLSAADNTDYSYIDENFQPESLQSWAKRACVINAQMKCYREAVLQGLADDGYTILDASYLLSFTTRNQQGLAADGYTILDDSELNSVANKQVLNSVVNEQVLNSVVNEQIVNEVKTAVNELQTIECEEVASSQTLTKAEFDKLQEKRAKTKSERQQERKAELAQRYGVDVTPELVGKDDVGWYPQLRLHYYLSLGREFLVGRDAKRAKAQVVAGNNAIWKPDFNRGQLLPAVMLLEELKISQLFNGDVEFRSSDVELQKLRSLAVQHKQVIKNYLGVSISQKDSAIAICQKFLKKLGMKLSYIGRFGSRENRERVYQFVPPQDERGVIFLAWLQRDEATSAFTQENVVDVNSVSTPNNKR